MTFFKAQTCAVLIVYLIGFFAVSASAQSDSDLQKMKDKITKIGIGGELTVTRRDGQEFYGSVSKIEDEFVTIRDVDLKANVEIHYDQIKKVEKGYGETRGFNGKRIPPKKRRIGLIIATAAILIPIIALVTAKD